MIDFDAKATAQVSARIKVSIFGTIVLNILISQAGDSFASSEDGFVATTEIRLLKLLY